VHESERNEGTGGSRNTSFSSKGKGSGHNNTYLRKGKTERRVKAKKRTMSAGWRTPTATERTQEDRASYVAEIEKRGKNGVPFPRSTNRDWKGAAPHTGGDISMLEKGQTAERQLSMKRRKAMGISKSRGGGKTSN